MKTKLICFEGPNGVGKSTILRIIERRLYLRNISYNIFRDSEYPEMEEAREKVRKGSFSTPKEVTKIIAEARGRVYSRYFGLGGEFVFLNRGYYTSAVLQSDENLSVEEIVAENTGFGVPIPDKTLIFMAPINTLLERIRMRDRKYSMKYNHEFLSRQIRGYQEILECMPECSRIDNSGPSVNLTADIVMGEIL